MAGSFKTSITDMVVDSPQDLGGQLEKSDGNLADLFKTQKPVQYWEFQQHALACLLVGTGHVRSGEFRRSVEHLPQAALDKRSYYEKWAFATANVLSERGLITLADLEAALGQPKQPADVE